MEQSSLTFKEGKRANLAYIRMFIQMLKHYVSGNTEMRDEKQGPFH